MCRLGGDEGGDFSDIYDNGYIIYNDGEITHIDSSIMKFYDLKLSLDDFKNEDELIAYVKSNLKADKENYLRLKVDGNISKKKIKNELNLSYFELEIDEDSTLYDMVSLYPNSLLDKYMEKFPKNTDKLHKRALELGIDAIYRSRDE